MRRTLAFALSLFCCASFAADLPENKLDAGRVTAQGKPVTLLGKGLTVGEDAPNFKVVDERFTAVTLENYKGQAGVAGAAPGGAVAGHASARVRGQPVAQGLGGGVRIEQFHADRHPVL